MKVNRIKITDHSSIDPMSDRVLLSPYQGCTHRCLFCPANDNFLEKKAFLLFNESNELTVVENIVEILDESLLKFNKKVRVHLSPVADPFQPINDCLKITQRIINVCNKHNCPVTISTKAILPKSAILLLKKNVDPIIELTIVSIDENIRKYIVRGGGAPVYEMLEQVRRLSSMGFRIVVRIDPIFPLINDNPEKIEELIKNVKGCGAEFIVTSVADIVEGALEKEKEYLDSFSPGLYEKYKELYVYKNGRMFHASREYRLGILGKMLKICRAHGIMLEVSGESDLKNFEVEA